MKKIAAAFQVTSRHEIISLFLLTAVAKDRKTSNPDEHGGGSNPGPGSGSSRKSKMGDSRSRPSGVTGADPQQLGPPMASVAEEEKVLIESARERETKA